MANRKHRAPNQGFAVGHMGGRDRVAALNHELRLRSLLYLTTPDKWPLGDVLPLKRPSRIRGEFPECGVIVRDDLLTVWVNSNVLLGDPRTQPGALAIQYESAEKILQDRWQID